mmetsp:Transcript_9789/g.32643  ORF Transcript_9789/g.32643 Transcript_9789/m.32643 type:complete len:252 (+) Transcript_9789:131-886(+)
MRSTVGQEAATDAAAAAGHPTETRLRAPLDDSLKVLDAPLNMAAMRRAAAAMEGEHDWAALCTAPASQATRRTVASIEVRARRHVSLPLLGCLCAPSGGGRCELLPSGSCGACGEGGGEGEEGEEGEAGPVLELRFTGGGFLRHQVRRMASLLVAVGTGREPEGTVRLALSAAATAPAAERGVGAEGEAGLEAEEGEGGAAGGRRSFMFERRRIPPAPACGLWLEHVDCSPLLDSTHAAGVPLPEETEVRS